MYADSIGDERSLVMLH